VSHLHHDDARQADPLWRHAHLLRCLHAAHQPRLDELAQRRRRILTARRIEREDRAERELAQLLESLDLDNAPADAPWQVRLMVEENRMRLNMARWAEGGRIGMVIESRDSDCVYSVRAKVLNARWPTVQAYMQRTEDGADGPVHFRLCRPSSLREFEPVTRDLVLEAMEEGHPHHVVSPIG